MTAPAGARRRPGLRAHLLALVLAVLMPALVFGAVASWAALRRQDQAEEARLMDTAQALASAVDAQIGAGIAALRVLAATSAPEAERDLEHLLAHVRATADTLGTWVTLYRRDGSQVLHTRSAGAPPDRRADPAVIERASATGRPAVSNVTEAGPDGPAKALIFVPMQRDGTVRYVLAMPLAPEALADTLRGQATGGDGSVALTDGRGVFAAHSRDDVVAIGSTRLSRAADPPREPGVMIGRRVPDGAPIRTAYHPLATAPGWHVWVNEPEATFSEARDASLRALAGGGALALALGLAGALLVARRVLSPVQALVWRAEMVARGQVAPEAPEPPAAVAEFDRLSRAVADSEAALRRVQRIGQVGGFEIDLRTGTNIRSAEYMVLQGRQALATEERHADWVRRLHPEDRVRAERHFLASIADDAPDTDYAQEYRIVTPDNEVRWIYARAEIERAADGRALRMVGAHVDVTALKSAEAALRDSEARLRLALEAAQLGAWEIDLLTGTAERTPGAQEVLGFGREQLTAAYSSWRERVHPDDRATLDESIEEVRTGRLDQHRIVYRFRRGDGRWAWIESHGRGARHDPMTGLPTRLIGTSQDVTDRREAEERQLVLIHELDHRAKNTLAVVQAALRLTPRHDAAAYARAVEGRVAALARAHTLLAKGHWRGAELRAVAENALTPFLGGQPAGASAGPHASFEGPGFALSPPAVQALSMAFHELATNAAKHGALSVPSGRVILSWEVEADRLSLRWQEQGGPPVSGAPAGRGFGSSLIEATIARQLNAEMRLDWAPDGLVWTARIPLSRICFGQPEAAPLAEPATLPV